MLNQCIGEAFSSVIRMYNQVLQIATPSIMSRHDASNDLILDEGNETEIWISIQIACCIFSRVGVAKSDSSVLLHQIND